MKVGVSGSQPRAWRLQEDPWACWGRGRAGEVWYPWGWMGLDRLGTSCLQSSFFALRHLCLVITNAAWKGVSLKTNWKSSVPKLQAEHSLSLACQRIPALQTSCEASQGRTSFLWIPFSAAAVNLQRGLLRQALFWTLPCRPSGALLHSTYRVVIFFPLWHCCSPHSQAGLSLSLTNSFSGPTPKGVLSQSNTSLLFYHNFSRPDKVRQRGREGTGRVGAGFSCYGGR